MIGYQISYAIPIFLRVTESRDTYAHHTDKQNSNKQTHRFPKGAFNLGRWGVPLGWISAIWCVLACAYVFERVFRLTATAVIFVLPSTGPFDEVNAQK